MVGSVDGSSVVDSKVSVDEKFSVVVETKARVVDLDGLGLLKVDVSVVICSVVDSDVFVAFVDSG